MAKSTDPASQAFLVRVAVGGHATVIAPARAVDALTARTYAAIGASGVGGPGSARAEGRGAP